ncbi:hypothetical protein BU23DRAFT_557272 [Bimuria novae-zelandiae CBS 107.79]|uniref:Uncharacterized protein n=1 Tax=Bimuria novae-zelandiae CBS 107.79 TaxID=1447943 RepID=A0A6A5UXH6_9PLEO|nr:hypothetical protein BU23DRAFT_557272 [Bimuria novae-zelandiae CBS 107.79]
MADSNPAISLYLDGELSFQLHRKGFAGTTPNLMIQMHDTSNAITLVIPGYQMSTKSFNLPLALQGGLLALFDAESNTRIAVPPSSSQPGKLLVKSGAPNQWFDLKLDPRDDFWSHLLTPGHKYEIRWANVPQAYRSDPHQQSSDSVPIRLLPRPIKLAIFSPATAPPHFSLTLTPTANICHLTGSPPFGFKLSVTSQETYPITICLHKTPLKELHGLEEIAKVVDEEGEEVEWPWGIGCWEGPESFPSDDAFEEFTPGRVYERMFWLERVNRETANGGELEEMQTGRRYRVEVGKGLLGAFGQWRKGGKAELLQGSEKEKKERWSGSSGQAILEVSEPFYFETV